MNTKHTPEPWEVVGDRDIYSDTIYHIAKMNSMSCYAPANALRIVYCVNALAGKPEGYVEGLEKALQQAIRAAEYVVELCEANCNAGIDPNPNVKSDWVGTVAHCYAAMNFVTTARAALKLKEEA